MRGLLFATAIVLASSCADGAAYYSYPLAAPLTGSEVLGPVRQNGSDTTVTAQALANLVIQTEAPSLSTTVNNDLASAISAEQASLQNQVQTATTAAAQAQTSAQQAAAAAQQAAASAGGGLSASTLGTANGPAKLDANKLLPGSEIEANSPGNAAVYDVNGNLHVPNLYIGAMQNDGAVMLEQYAQPPTSPAYLPGQFAMAFSGEPAPSYQPAPTTETVQANVGDKFLTVANTQGIQPGSNIYVLNPSTDQCYGGDSTPTVFGIAGLAQASTGRVSIEALFQNPVGTFGYGAGQGLLSNATGSTTAGTLSIPVGAQVTFFPYTTGGTLSHCAVVPGSLGNGGATMAVSSSAGGVNIDGSAQTTGPAIALALAATMGPADKVSDDAFAENPVCTLLAGALGTCITSEMDVTNDSGSFSGTSSDLTLGSNGSSYIGVLGNLVGASLKGFQFNLNNGAQTDEISIDQSNAILWDTGNHAVAAAFGGHYTNALFSIPTADTTSVPAPIVNYAQPSSSASGSTTVTLTIPSGGSAPVVGSAIGNSCCGNPFGNNITFPASDTITANSVSGTTDTVTLSAAITGESGGGVVTQAPATFVNDNNQIIWALGAHNNAGLYSPGDGSGGTPSWEVGPVPDGVGATFDLGPPSHLLTIAQSGALTINGQFTVNAAASVEYGLTVGSEQVGTTTHGANTTQGSVYAGGTTAINLSGGFQADTSSGGHTWLSGDVMCNNGSGGVGNYVLWSIHAAYVSTGTALTLLSSPTASVTVADGGTAPSGWTLTPSSTGTTPALSLVVPNPTDCTWSGKQGFNN